MSSKRLLILSCSSRKRDSQRPMPALERYDGPAYKTVRKALRENRSNGLRIIILSAKYGLISPTEPIRNYNLKMTKLLAEKHSQPVQKKLRALLKTHYDDVFVYGGALYRSTLTPDTQWSNGLRIKYSSGPIGKQLQQLKNWLR